MQFYIYFSRFFMIAISEGNNKINIEEPFKGLFLRNGMSQLIKQSNEWLSLMKLRQLMDILLRKK